jgi:hypothetical protein
VKDVRKKNQVGKGSIQHVIKAPGVLSGHCHHTISLICPFPRYSPAAHDSSRHHTDRVESGDKIGSGGGEVEGKDHRQLEEHGVINLVERTRRGRNGER